MIAVLPLMKYLQLEEVGCWHTSQRGDFLGPVHCQGVVGVA